MEKFQYKTHRASSLSRSVNTHVERFSKVLKKSSCNNDVGNDNMDNFQNKAISFRKVSKYGRFEKVLENFNVVLHYNALSDKSLFGETWDAS